MILSLSILSDKFEIETTKDKGTSFQSFSFKRLLVQPWGSSQVSSTELLLLLLLHSLCSSITSLNSSIIAGSLNLSANVDKPVLAWLTLLTEANVSTFLSMLASFISGYRLAFKINL